MIVISSCKQGETLINNYIIIIIIYISCFTGSEICSYNIRYIRESFIALRKMMRNLFKLPNRTNNYIVCSIVECII